MDWAWGFRCRQGVIAVLRQHGGNSLKATARIEKKNDLRYQALWL